MLSWFLAFNGNIQLVEHLYFNLLSVLPGFYPQSIIHQVLWQQREAGLSSMMPEETILAAVSDFTNEKRQLQAQVRHSKFLQAQLRFFHCAHKLTQQQLLYCTQL